LFAVWAGLSRTDEERAEFVASDEPQPRVVRLPPAYLPDTVGREAIEPVNDGAVVEGVCEPAEPAQDRAFVLEPTEVFGPVRSRAGRHATVRTSASLT
jgi:hypothetical protein